MSKEKEILRQQYTRLVEQLMAVDPTREPKLYMSLLKMIEHVAWLPTPEELEENKAKAQKIVAGFFDDKSLDRPLTPVVETEPEEPSVEEFEPPVPYQGPANEPDPMALAKTYTKEEVRAALAKSRKSGVNVTELLGEFGAENFTGLPAAKYPEIMARLGES